MGGTNLEAAAVNTVEWLSEVPALAVPVYQRHYRWDIGRCRRLLEDLRAAADSENGRAHFFGSVLASTAGSAGDELTLIDGQQRLTTVTLLAAALMRASEGHAPLVANDLRRLLVHPTRSGATKLMPHEGRAADLEAIVFGHPVIQPEAGESSYWDNFDYFLGQVHADAGRVWQGLQRLEHVLISLPDGRQAQQVFESLNATSAPLRDHELVHNYVLMGLPQGRQRDVEAQYWVPIENHCGAALDGFLRDYLIQRTGRDSGFDGEHGVYQMFKDAFPRLTVDSTAVHAQDWKEAAEAYGDMLRPARVQDPDIARQLAYVNVFGTAMYPIVLAIYRDHRAGVLGKDVLLDTLSQLQAMYLRRMVVGESRDHLAAQLCRRRLKSGHPIREIARRTPSDERIRSALRYRPLPHAGHVLQRLQDVDSLDGLQIEHIFPQTPLSTWSGGTGRMWADFDEGERAQFRERLDTLGNLTLLEQPLNAGAGNKPFLDKRSYYLASTIASTAALAEVTTWDVAAIGARTDSLTDLFLATWPRRAALDEDDPDHLVPILYAEEKPGYYEGWKTEYEYVRFGDELWEVRDVRTLFIRVYERLWAERRDDVLAYSTARGAPIYGAREWNGRWEPLGGSHFLFTGWYPRYLLADLKGLLDEVGMADDVLLKYSSEGG